MPSYRVLKDENHLGGVKAGTILSCEGEPTGGLAALVKFGQAKLVEDEAPEAAPAPVEAVEAAEPAKKASPAPARKAARKRRGGGA